MRGRPNVPHQSVCGRRRLTCSPGHPRGCRNAVRDQRRSRNRVRERVLQAIGRGHLQSTPASQVRGWRCWRSTADDVEWGTPVLFMRVPDGRLFDFAAQSGARPLSGASPDARADAAVRRPLVARPTQAPRIFINYRRDDTAGHARHLSRTPRTAVWQRERPPRRRSGFRARSGWRPPGRVKPFSC